MAGANLKAFVSETEISEERQRRQEEWEKVRTEDQPKECPEEEYDPRTLFEKLQDQKDKKQSDFEEQFKFKNMVRGIDDEESKFLNEVAEKHMKIEMERMSEEKKLIREYKESVVNRTVAVAAPSESAKASMGQLGGRKAVASGSKRSQAALLAGAVKRKRPTTEDEPKKSERTSLSTEPAAPSTKPAPDVSSSNGHSAGRDRHSNAHWTSESEEEERVGGGDGTQGVQCIAVLPGIGSYSNSSDDSDLDSTDSEGVELMKTVFHKGSCRHKSESK